VATSQSVLIVPLSSHFLCSVQFLVKSFFENCNSQLYWLMINSKGKNALSRQVVWLLMVSASRSSSEKCGLKKLDAETSNWSPNSLIVSLETAVKAVGHFCHSGWDTWKNVKIFHTNVQPIWIVQSVNLPSVLSFAELHLKSSYFRYLIIKIFTLNLLACWKNQKLRFWNMLSIKK